MSKVQNDTAHALIKGKTHTIRKPQVPLK